MAHQGCSAPLLYTNGALVCDAPLVWKTLMAHQKNGAPLVIIFFIFKPPIACEGRCVSVLYQILLFVVIRNIVNYVVIPLAQLYGTKWIEKHFDDNEKQLSFSETLQGCEQRIKKHPSFWTAGCFSCVRFIPNLTCCCLYYSMKQFFKSKKQCLRNTTQEIMKKKSFRII